MPFLEAIGQQLKRAAAENKDRSGFERGAAYRRENYQDCPRCPDPRKADPSCSVCGGYGEIPKDK